MSNRNLLNSLNPYDLHKHLINAYILIKPGSFKQFQRDTSKDKTDLDVIRENHRFLWDNVSVDCWEKQLAKKYYDKLFKEYCICDLTRYKENKVALRWRTETEVVIGKGQFICGNKSCIEKDGLRSWEVNFSYTEDQQKKNVLIKLRLCPTCSNKLNYHSKKREIKRNIKRIKKVKKQKYKFLTTDKQQSCIESNDSKNESSDKKHTVNDNPDIFVHSPEETTHLPLPENTWTKATQIEDKSREEEFDEYLENLLL